MYKEKKVSVIFPAYNEGQNIRDAVNDFFFTGIVDEVIVVDNRSKDNTVKEALSTQAKLIREERRGYGYALRRGLREAKGDLIIMAEPDGTFVGKDIFKLLAYADDFQLVLGTRTAKELIWKGANMNFFLRFGNTCVAKLLSWLYSGPSLTDCGCTLRLIKREALDKIIGQLTVGGSHFLPEMVILALKKGISLIEIPVNYRSRIGSSKITGNFWRAVITGLNMVGLIIRYKFKGGKGAK